MRPFLLFLTAGLVLAACDQTPLGPDAASVAPQKDLPDGLVYNENNRNYYEAVAAEATTWEEANAAVDGSAFRQCRAHLAVITSADENAWITENFPEAAEQGYWLGGKQAPDETDPAAGWSWVTGEPFLYTNWAGGEPNDVPSDEESLQFRPIFFGSGDGTWNDINTDNTDFVGGYLVEYECPTRVTGGGGLSDGVLGFNALKASDASVKGQAEVHFIEDSGRLHLEVTCQSVWGNSAWAGGVTTRSDNPDFPVGTEFWWRVVDNGEGAGAESDANGYFFYSPGGGRIAKDCALQIGRTTGFLFEWERGNLQVH